MKPKRLLTTLIAITAVASTGMLSGCSSATDSGSESASGPTTLTLWLDGDCSKGDCVETPLIDGFQKANPDIKINLVSQPVSSYFEALQSASVTGTGPDLANMWPGGYMTPFLPYMNDVSQYMPKETIKQSSSAKYYAKDNDPNKEVYAVPAGDQWYVGFYNKKLLADNGISSPPKTWDDLNAACNSLKSKGVLPAVNGAEYGAATMGPLPEFSYLASTLPPSDWSKLYDGSLKYNNPELRSQVQAWADQYKNGCLNKDAFNAPDPQSKFVAGEAAMFFASGSWEVKNIYEKMGDNVGLLVPPYSTQPQHSLVETAGSAYAVMKYSKHQAEAGKFAAYILSDEGQQIIAKFGLPPTRPGFSTAIPMMNDLIKMSSTPGTTLYPMFDNFTQPGVTDAMTSKLPQVLVGQLSVDDGLSGVDAAFDALPAKQKDVHVNLSSGK